MLSFLEFDFDSSLNLSIEVGRVAISTSFPTMIPRTRAASELSLKSTTVAELADVQNNEIDLVNPLGGLVRSP